MTQNYLLFCKDETVGDSSRKSQECIKISDFSRKKESGKTALLIVQIPLSEMVFRTIISPGEVKELPVLTG